MRRGSSKKISEDDVFEHEKRQTQRNYGVHLEVRVRKEVLLMSVMILGLTI